MSRKDIFHIHWGTGGNGGLYIDEIYQALLNSGYRQSVFVSYYYPFDYGNKLFFKYSDIAHCRFTRRIRLFIQVIEVAFSLMVIILYSLIYKPRIVNYSLVSGSFPFVYYFLKTVRFISGCKIVVTCHDVMPFGDNSKKLFNELHNRKKIFKFADYLLVHNMNSAKTLIEEFDIEKQKIVYHRFPLQDLRKLHKLKQTDKKYDFLFVGHLRQEKGVELLRDAWIEFHKAYPNAKLCIAGRNISNIDFNSLLSANADLKLEYIDDNAFCNLIQCSNTVVLPYLSGTNSGIVSNVLSLGADVITSNLPMFKENPLINTKDMFRVGDIAELICLMKEKYSNPVIKGDSFNRLKRYRIDFTEEVLSVYKQII